MKGMMILGLIALLLLAGVALAQPAVSERPPCYEVEPGVASGGGYQLTSLAWRIDGTVRGGGYLLTAPTAPQLQGSGCCCTYLPLVMRKFR